MKYMLIAGEASGDLHASRLIKEIRNLDPDAEFCFFGGSLMAKAAGKEPALNYSEMNVMGFSEVFKKLPTILSNYKKAVELLDSFRPDTLILVDYPSFNLRLARAAKKRKIRVDYYISPKVWAWKTGRIKKIRKYVDFVYSILPFEPAFYKRYGFDRIEYVGNPSVEEMDFAMGHLPPKRHFLERNGLDDSRPLIALLPGSRKSEIRNNLPIMMEAVKKYPEFQCVVAAAPSIPEKFYREIAGDMGLTVVFDSTPILLKYSMAALVTSGTATLETAIIGTPQVVCYRSNGSKLTYKIMKRLLKVRYVSLPNLINNNNVVPELLLHECTPKAISRELSPLLQPSPGRNWQLQGYKLMCNKLGTSVAPRCAAEMIVTAL